MNVKKTYLTLFLFLFTTLAVVSFQNCSKKFSIKTTETHQSSSSSSANSSLINTEPASSNIIDVSIENPTNIPQNPTTHDVNAEPKAINVPQTQKTCQFSISACLRKGLKTTFYYKNGNLYEPTSNNLMTLPAGMTDYFYLFNSNSSPEIYYQCDSNGNLRALNEQQQPIALEQPGNNACPIRPEMVAATKRYLEEIPIGTVTPFSEGTLYRNSNGAFFVDKRGFGYQFPAIANFTDYNAAALRVPELARTWFKEFGFVPVGELTPAGVGLSPNSMTEPLTKVTWDSAGECGLKMKNWIVETYNSLAPGQKTTWIGHDVIRATWPGTLVILEDPRDGYNPHAIGVSHDTNSLLASNAFLYSLAAKEWGCK